MTTKNRVTLIAMAIVCIGSAALFGATNQTPRAPDDVSGKLEEIRGLMAESLRLQRIDLHPRHFKGHQLFKPCDFGDQCEAYERMAARHLLGDTRHEFGAGCVNAAACKKLEAETQKK